MPPGFDEVPLSKFGQQGFARQNLDPLLDYKRWSAPSPQEALAWFVLNREAGTEMKIANAATGIVPVGGPNSEGGLSTADAFDTSKAHLSMPARTSL